VATFAWNRWQVSTGISGNFRAEYALSLPSVPSNIFEEFLCPEINAGFWRARRSASGVTMPETPVDEDDFSTALEDYVRRTREIMSMQLETIAEAMEETPHREFGRRVFWPDPGH
jgi:hypothetical protein